MDLLNELESLVQKSNVEFDDVLSDTNIKRWQTLFDLSSEQAEAKITSHFSDLDRCSISNEYWATVQEEQEALGHDKETYAFFLGKKDKKKADARIQVQNQAPRVPKAKGVLKKRWLFKMTASCDTAAKVQVAAKLARLPETLRDEEEGTVTLVEVDVFAKEAIEFHHEPNITVEFIPRRVPAEKALCDTSVAPTLGLDTTLPQPPPQTHDKRYGRTHTPSRISSTAHLQNQIVCKDCSIAMRYNLLCSRPSSSAEAK